VKQRIWLAREFELGCARDAFPEVVERVRGTPARLEERLSGVDLASLRRRRGDGWSIQEHVGHLDDLEPLWAGRLDDLLEGKRVLRPADLSNTATHRADHNTGELVKLLTAFRRHREAVVARLEALTPEHLGRTAQHPRLEQPMSIVDLFYFVAEHDDHHLATITRLMENG
jgi:uncharacterized damage-inducible protein DinB